jgi:hypothetical protein
MSFSLLSDVVTLDITFGEKSFCERRSDKATFRSGTIADELLVVVGVVDVAVVVVVVDGLLKIQVSSSKENSVSELDILKKISGFLFWNVVDETVVVIVVDTVVGFSGVVFSDCNND